MSSARYKRSDNPDAVIVRDRQTGLPVRIPIQNIPEILRPDTWYENPYWRYSGALTENEVREILADPSKGIRALLAMKAAKYIIDFAKNTASAVWIFNPDRDGYLEFMRPHLAKLDALRSKARTRKDLWEMISTCLDAAIDPF